MLFFLLLPEGGAATPPPPSFSSPLSYPRLLSVLNSPCPLQDEEVLEDPPEEEEEEDVTSVMTSTSQEEVRSKSSAAQVGQHQIPADQSEHCWAADSVLNKLDCYSKLKFKAKLS